MILKFASVGVMMFHLVVVFCNDKGELVLTAKVKYRDNLELTCITTDVGRAITWDSQIVEKQIMPETKLLYTEKFAPESWFQENSLKNTLGPILDSRWENLPTVMSQAPPYNLKFALLKTINVVNKFELPISVRLESEGHIYICQESNYPPEANCYWILLGAWNGNASAIRKCKRGQISKESEAPSGDCRIERDKVALNPLSKNAWKHFTIIFDNVTKLISIFFVGDTKPFLQFQDDNYEENVRYLSIWVNSRQKRHGFWKLHSYDYYIHRSLDNKIFSSNERVGDSFCVSMYISMCESCTLVLSLIEYYSRQVVGKQTFISSKESSWTNIKFKYKRRISSEWFHFNFKLENSNRNIIPFLAVDNVVKSTNCFEKDIKYSRISIQKNNIDTTFCQYLTDQEYKIKLNLNSTNQPETKCKLDAMGTECITCTEVLDGCKNHLICEKLSDEDQCYCGAGSSGEFCQNDCSWMTFGINCNEKCGSCKQNSCDRIDGKCSKGCEDNFIVPECKRVKFPIYIGEVIMQSNCYTNCDLQFDSSKYIGEERPVYYRAAYKQISATKWFHSQDIPLQQSNSFTLQHLEISANYNLRIILLTGIKEYYFGDNIPITNFTTICKEITKDEITLQTEGRRSIFSTKLVSGETACTFWRYYIIVAQNGIIITRKDLAESVIIDNLTPSTVYEYTIFAKPDTPIINSMFKTDEIAPGKVKNVHYNSTSNEITIFWDKPDQENGILRKYVIYYEHTKYIFCPNRRDHESKNTIESLDNIATITNLNPYSIYTIKIKAVNKYEGTEAVFDNMQTESLKELNKEAYTITPQADSRHVTLNLTPKCEVITSPIYMTALVRCSEIWCNTKKERVITLPKSKEVFDGLQPFSNHELIVTISDDPSFANFEMLPTINFKTDTAEPNMVPFFDFYSKDSTSISLRWIPPYPPTGEIEKYKVEYKQYRYSFQSSENFENCSIWPMMYCMKIPQLARDDYYYIQISAKNKGVFKWSPLHKLETYINIEKPMQPEKLELFWDDLYNLTVRWQHPNRTNGRLRLFKVKIGSMMEVEYKVVKENFTYTYNEKVEPKEGTLQVSVCSVNAAAPSSYAFATIYYPPEIPKLKAAPKVTKQMNTSIEIEIPSTKDLKSEGYMYVIVTQLPDVANHLNPSKFDIAQICSSATKAFKIKELKNVNTILIGTGEVQNWDHCQITDRVLKAGSKFVIDILLYNEHKNLTRGEVYRLETSTTEGEEITAPVESNPAIYALLILLVVPILLGIFIVKKKKVRIGWPSHSTRGSNPDTIPLTKTPSKEKKVINGMGNLEVVPPKFSNPVKLVAFEKYVKESIFNGELARQHALFPRGEQRPNEYGKMPQNKSKNRYMNLVSYNHSRVKLRKINGDAFSDYINANYIKSFDSTKGYIATQGPKPNTVDDFWRMIWEENVVHIVMLANVMENGKKKTEKYWPNYNEDVDYGNVNVSHISTEVFADYEIRVLLIKCENEERKVEQLHFTTWPDHGVPLYPQSLVPFVKRILTFPHDIAPIVVHCSAGVGRTGTIILIDICLRMAAQTSVVDVLRNQYLLREQRTNMVDNLEQYKLVHLVVYECLFSPDTTLPCDEGFEQAMMKTIKDDLKEQMDYIKRSAWQEEAISGKDETAPKRQPKKDRFVDADPPEMYGILYLTPSPSTDDTSTYINAVAVDGFKAPKSFITTQQPLPHTVGDFWRLVTDNDVSIVISLQEINLDDPTCCNFWPDESQNTLSATENIELHHTQTESIDTFDVISVSMITKRETRKVVVIALKGWNYGAPYPINFAPLLAVWQQMNQLSWKENRVVVTCKDGITGCGLYTAMCFTLEKIKLEQVCDVCHAVRVVRRSRKKFVESEIQFASLYEIVLLYLNEFELYSNFSSK